MPEPELNPYAAPLASITGSRPAPQGDLLRDGKFLIARSSAKLPEMCPVTGEELESMPGSRRVRCLVWVPRWALIGLFMGFLPYLLFSAAFRREGYGISPREIRKRHIKRTLGTALLTAGIGCLILACSTTGKALLPIALAVPVLLIAGGVFFAIAEPITVAGYRWEGWFKLRGCSPHFLDTLPQVAFKSLD